jgi:tetratricopeptide (TPR) repeat protein
MPGMQKTNRFICDQGKFRHEIMRPKIPILLLLFLFLIIPAVSAEDVQEWYMKGQTAMTVGDYNAAVTYYSKVIQMDKNYASAYAGRATALNMLGKYNDAIVSADSALAIKSMDAVALNARAFAFFKLGQYEDATVAYDKLFVVEQNRKEAYCNQAYAYLKLNDTSARAFAAFDRCTMLDSDNFEAWNNKGLAMMHAGKYEAALSAFDRATYITIKNASVWNNKGEALVALGKPTDALECFKKALGIDPNYARAKANKEEATGKQQSFTIIGTITPKETISRIGTFFTTKPPATQVTEVITQVMQPEDTTPADMMTETSVPKKTTYSPLSPISVLGAVAFVASIVAVMKRK